MNNEKMTLGHALIEWESCGLDEVPIDNLIDMHSQLEAEIVARAKLDIKANAHD